MTSQNDTNDPFQLIGQSYLVTGGTRGIGHAISLQLARAGASVLANYVRDEQSADALKAQAEKEGLSLTPCRADITNPAGLKRLFESMDSWESELDGFIHCAATGVHKPVEEVTARHFDWTMNLNVKAFLELVRQLLPRIHKGGSIVALSSEGAVRALPQYMLVGASKGALEAMVRHLAAELGPRGIRVNALSPGSVPSDAWKVLPDAEKRLAEAAQRTPLGRLVTFEEVACSAQFLCSRAASGITGHTLVVDGGCRIVG